MGNDYETPRHRHNFSQIIMVLKGEHEWVPKTKRGPGSITYTCEVRFMAHSRAAAQRCSSHCNLAKQAAAASSATTRSIRAKPSSPRKALSPTALRHGIDDKGQKHNQDSYEAIWEYINGRPIEDSTVRSLRYANHDLPRRLPVDADTGRGGRRYESSLPSSPSAALRSSS